MRTSDQEVGSGIFPSRNLSTGMVIHRNGDDLGMVYGIGFTMVYHIFILLVV